jgi:hypothetical protein
VFVFNDDKAYSGKQEYSTEDNTYSSSEDYSDSSSASYSDSSDDSWDEELDELMTWVNTTLIGAPEIRRLRSKPVVSKTVARSRTLPSNGKVPINVKNADHALVLERISRSESFFQSPVVMATSKVIPAATSTKDSEPEAYLHAMFAAMGYDSNEFGPDDDDFLEVTPEQVAAHSFKLTNAARRGDLAFLEQHLKEGKPLQCCNRYGESIVHIVCRRGRGTLLRFLIEEAKVTVMVRDDVGRGPLHDAAWSDEPNFELVKMLLLQAPELMFLKDFRDHSPLAYVPRQHWSKWCDFLRENRSLLLSANPMMKTA